MSDLAPCPECRVFLPVSADGLMMNHYELIYGRAELCVGSGATALGVRRLTEEDVRRSTLTFRAR